MAALLNYPKLVSYLMVNTWNSPTNIRPKTSPLFLTSIPKFQSLQNNKKKSNKEILERC